MYCTPAFLYILKPLVGPLTYFKTASQMQLHKLSSRMKASTFVWLSCLSSKFTSSALVGFGILPYEPPCAFACDRSLSSFMLTCSDPMPMDMSMSMSADITSPQCRADDTSWLTTLAWCMHTQCASHDVKTSNLEHFWETQSTEDPLQLTAPKWDYSTTLFRASQPPNQTISDPKTTLNFTALVDPATYMSQWNALTTVQRENVVESSFGYEDTLTLDPITS